MPRLARWVCLPSPDRVALRPVCGEGDLVLAACPAGSDHSPWEATALNRSAPARRAGRRDPGPLPAAGVQHSAHREDCNWPGTVPGRGQGRVFRQGSMRGCLPANGWSRRPCTLCSGGAQPSPRSVSADLTAHLRERGCLSPPHLLLQGQAGALAHV